VTHELQQVDLAFVVDTTGSMGSFIAAARRQMVATLAALTADAATPVDLWLAVVEYRDHPPQDHTFVTRTRGLAPDLGAAQKVIDRLHPDGGGDGPEAVYDGVAAACDLAWRPYARRLAVLIGDAPPHGCGGAGDGFREGCPCGKTAESVTARCEGCGVTLYALGLTGAVNESFTRLATLTGGAYFEAREGAKAIAALEGVLAGEFAEIDFDRRVLTYCAETPGWTVDGVSDALSGGRGRVAASLARLGRRGLFRVEASSAR
jgi:hypothetical protein